MIYPQFVLHLIGALLKLTGDSRGHAKDISALVLIDIHVASARTNLTVQRLVYIFYITGKLKVCKEMFNIPRKTRLTKKMLCILIY